MQLLWRAVSSTSSTGLFQVSIIPPSEAHRVVCVVHHSSQSIFPIVTLFNSGDNFAEVGTIISCIGRQMLHHEATREAMVDIRDW